MGSEWKLGGQSKSKLYMVGWWLFIILNIAHCSCQACMNVYLLDHVDMQKLLQLQNSRVTFSTWIFPECVIFLCIWTTELYLYSYFKIHFGTDLHSLQELIVTSIIAFRVIHSILFVDILYLHSFQIKPMPILLHVFEDNTPTLLPFFKPEQTYC